MPIQTALFSMQDKVYREFHSALMPTVPKEKIIGVRVPALRKYAKTIQNTTLAHSFLSALPHTYYEENNLHAFLVSEIKDFSAALFMTKTFLPFIDNWATCDMFFPKIFQKHANALLPQMETWLTSKEEYTMRFAIGLYMRLFLDGDFSPAYPARIAAIKREEYYIRMMVAWYFATAISKQQDAVLPFLEENRLDKWTHNKTIQKAIESHRIAPETKSYLKTLRR